MGVHTTWIDILNVHILIYLDLRTYFPISHKISNVFISLQENTHKMYLQRIDYYRWYWYLLDKMNAMDFIEWKK